MTDNNLIPFSKELWETGEYEITECDNKIPPYIQEIFEGKVYYRIWDGREWIPSSDHLSFNTLMLRKKTKKKWYPILKSDGYETKELCDNSWINDENYLKAIEVEI